MNRQSDDAKAAAHRGFSTYVSCALHELAKSRICSPSAKPTFSEVDRGTLWTGRIRNEESMNTVNTKPQIVIFSALATLAESHFVMCETPYTSKPGFMI